MLGNVEGNVSPSLGNMLSVYQIYISPFLNQFSEIAFLEVPEHLGMNHRSWMRIKSGSSHLYLSTSPLFPQPRAKSVLKTLPGNLIKMQIPISRL